MIRPHPLFVATALCLAPVVSVASPPHPTTTTVTTTRAPGAPHPMPVVRPAVTAVLHQGEPVPPPEAPPAPVVAPAPEPVVAPAPTPLPVGVATSPAEAPGGAHLAPMPTETPSPGGPVQGDPAQERSMTFTAGGGPVCRETVPGGTLLVVAYAIVLAVMGLYVATLARKNSVLATKLTELEDEIARRRGTVPDEAG